MRIASAAALALLTAFSDAHAALTLSSPAFANNGVLPNQFTYSMEGQCSGPNVSPPLLISGAPAGTRSFALTVLDPDGENFLHWKAWNIAAEATSIPQNASRKGSFSEAANEFGTPGYGGACPPTPNHRYIFTLYALNTTFASEPTTAQLQAASLATTTLTAMRSPTSSVSWGPNECLFSWGERGYPALLSPPSLDGGGSLTLGEYTYRYYANTNAYIGVSSKDGRLYFLGAATNFQLLDLGLAKSWMTQAGCD